MVGDGATLAHGRQEVKRLPFLETLACTCAGAEGGMTAPAGLADASTSRDRTASSRIWEILSRSVADSNGASSKS